MIFEVRFYPKFDMPCFLVLTEWINLKGSFGCVAVPAAISDFVLVPGG